MASRPSTQRRGARTRLDTPDGPVAIYRLRWLVDEAIAEPDRLPNTVKILLENLLRRSGTPQVVDEDVVALARWPASDGVDLTFIPSRILMQDFTGVPAVVDLAAMRSAVARAGGDGGRVNPIVPVDLVIDHSLQVDRFGAPDSLRVNIDWEYRRNAERYELLRWAQHAFGGFRVVPPGMGICHQVNLEYLARIVQVRDGVAFPDTLVGTDSHTTMINGLGVLGWGVGGIEAEAAMLGQALPVTWPQVVGIRVEGVLPATATTTDLVLTLTEMLREHGVVGRFVEFFGAGLSTLEVPDRATLANMSPEYGATAALFPVDGLTLRYLRDTGRGQVVDLVERYTKEQGLFRTDAEPDLVFTEVLELDLSIVEPSMAGPTRPQDRVPLHRVRESFEKAFRDRLAPQPKATEVGRFLSEGGADQPNLRTHALPDRTPLRGSDAAEDPLDHGSVVIAAITSCTNTSNPSVMVQAGLLAKKAVEAGLRSRPWVKTSLAPGSRVVTDYLDRAGLTPYLQELGFGLVGYGCTTCIGNSGPLPEPVAQAIRERNLLVAAVLSGNRNYEGRIHPLVRASYLASPPLCVAYALAGRIDQDLTRDPLGTCPDGSPVYLRDIWPSADEVRQAIASAVSPEQFGAVYGHVFEGDERWSALPAPGGSLYEWDPASTYVREPPFFQGIAEESAHPGDILDARVLVLLGDSVTTDHISPAGSITADSPAGRYLQDLGVTPLAFNSYGSRRGNHEVMLRGTFANPRLRNQLAPGTEGPQTMHLPSGQRMTIYEAASRYREEAVPLIVIAGKDYGAGSSRDWAAKGTALLGVRVVLAEGFERIHRSNLVGMGVLPLQFRPGDSSGSLGLTGHETFSVRGLSRSTPLPKEVTVEVYREDGGTRSFPATVSIEGTAEADYFREGGILPMVARRLLSEAI